MGAQVALLCRSRERGEATTARIRDQTGNGALQLVLTDLESQAEIRKAAAEILDRFPQIDVLVNNAGITNLSHARTCDGVECVFAVNHLAPFLLTNLLLDRLCATPGARIVNVASEAHRFGTIRFDDLGYERRYRWMRAYGQSKLANILFTRELDRRIRDRGASANSLHPGAVATGLGSNNGVVYRVVMPFVRPFLRTPERGAECSLYLATSPEIEGTSGGYYIDCKPRCPSSEARNDRVARRLWRVSERLTGLS